MANGGGRDLAGEPLFWAIVRLVHRGGMPAVTVRAAAAEAHCSVGLMRHYYDTKSVMLACAYELVVHAQLWAFRNVLLGRRNRILSPVPPEPLTPERAARLLVGHLGLDRSTDMLVGVQVDFLALGRHDGRVGEAVASHLGGLRELCVVVLEECGVPAPAVAEEGTDLWALLVGLTALVPGLAVEGDEEESLAAREALLTAEAVESAVRRHLEGVAARHALDA